MVAEEVVKKIKTPTATQKTHSMEKDKKDTSTRRIKQDKERKKNVLKCAHCKRYGHAKTTCRFLKRKLQDHGKDLQKELQEVLLETFCSKIQVAFKALLQDVLKDFPNEFLSLNKKIDKMNKKIKLYVPNFDPPASSSPKPTTSSEKNLKETNQNNQCLLQLITQTERTKQNHMLQSFEVFNVVNLPQESQKEKDDQSKIIAPFTKTGSCPENANQQPKENYDHKQKKEKIEKNMKNVKCPNALNKIDEEELESSTPIKQLVTDPLCLPITDPFSKTIPKEQIYILKNITIMNEIDLKRDPRKSIYIQSKDKKMLLPYPLHNSPSNEQKRNLRPCDFRRPTEVEWKLLLQFEEELEFAHNAHHRKNNIVVEQRTSRETPLKHPKMHKPPD